MSERDTSTGKFAPKPDSLSRKTYGVRVRKGLDEPLADLAAQSGMTLTEYCRYAVEAAIANKMVFDPPTKP